MKDWTAPAKDPLECLTCGLVHTKGTYDRPSRLPELGALEVIAPGQRIPYMKGAAVAFGLMGMAEAIRRNYCCYNCGEYVGPALDDRPAVFRCLCWMDE